MSSELKRQLHNDKMREYMRAKRALNRPAVKKQTDRLKPTDRMKCCCGATVTRNHKARHEKTKLHLKRLGDGYNDDEAKRRQKAYAHKKDSAKDTAMYQAWEASKPPDNWGMVGKPYP